MEREEHPDSPPSVRSRRWDASRTLYGFPGDRRSRIHLHRTRSCVVLASDPGAEDEQRVGARVAAMVMDRAYPEEPQVVSEVAPRVSRATDRANLACCHATPPTPVPSGTPLPGGESESRRTADVASRPSEENHARMTIVRTDTFL